MKLGGVNYDSKGAFLQGTAKIRSLVLLAACGSYRLEHLEIITALIHVSDWFLLNGDGIRGSWLL